MSNMPVIKRDKPLTKTKLGKLAAKSWFYYAGLLYNKIRSEADADCCYCIDDGLTYYITRSTVVEI